MKKNVKSCFECETTKGEFEEHHIIPESSGGKKTVLLCIKCHMLVHGIKSMRRDNHRELTMEGLKKAKAKGITGGRPRVIRNISDLTFKRAFRLEETNMIFSVANVCKGLGISKATLYRTDSLLEKTRDYFKKHEDKKMLKKEIPDDRHFIKLNPKTKKYEKVYFKDMTDEYSDKEHANEKRRIAYAARKKLKFTNG